MTVEVHNHTPADRSLALIDRSLIKERPYLTTEQERLMGELTLGYLKRKKLVFNHTTLRDAFEVLAYDALPRGLVLTGQRDVGTNSNLRNLIRIGLINREDVKAKTEGALASEGKSKDLTVFEGEFVGTYALRKDLVAKAANTLAGFPLIPDIASCDLIIYQFESRKRILPIVAQAVIDTLPKELFPDASLDKIPDDSDRAKLIRNSLISLAFRKTPYPTLSIEQLKEILANFKLDEKLNKVVLEKITGILLETDLMRSRELTDYISALLSQATYYLMHPKIISLKKESDSIGLIDSIYSKMSPVFLLLHPSLEGERFITDPSDPSLAGKDSYSLWSSNLSTVIDGFRFPTQQGLMRAVRFYTAQGLDISKYREALKAWNLYTKSEKQERDQVPNLRETIEQIDQKIKSILLGVEELPPYAYDLMRIFNRDIHDQVMSSRSQYSGYEQRIREAIVEPKEAESYYQKILRENEGIIPDRMRAPESIIQRRKSALKSSYSSQRELASRILEENFFAEIELKGKGLISWDKLTDAELSQEIESLRFALDRIRLKGRIPGDLPGIEGLAKAIEKEFRLLDGRVNRKRNNRVRAVAGDRERLSDIRPIYSHVMDWRFAPAVEKKKIARKITKSFYLFELSNQFSALVLLQRAREVNKSLAEDPESEIHYWTREEMLRWKKMSTASNFPTEAYTLADLKRFKEEAVRWQDEYFKVDAYFKRNLLPEEITSIDELKEHLKSKSDLFQQLEETQPPTGEQAFWDFERKKRNLEQQVTCLKNLFDLLGNPLFPFSDSIGLSGKDFITAVFSRINLTTALISVNEGRKKVITLEQAYDSLVRSTYVEYLMKRKKKADEELDTILNNPRSKAKLIEGMTNLGLAIPEPK